MTRDRSHTYLYTVEIRVNGGWQERQVEAWNMEQAAHKLKVEQDDCRFVTKRIL